MTETEEGVEFMAPHDEAATTDTSLSINEIAGKQAVDSLKAIGEYLPEGCTWGFTNQGLKIPICSDPAPPPRAAVD